MTQQPEPIVFKCEASLWEMLVNGTKPFDMRRFDIRDNRIDRLTRDYSSDMYDGVMHHKDDEFALPEIFDEKQVSFQNKETGEIATFLYKGMRFAPWAGDWCFILLGARVNA